MEDAIQSNNLSDIQSMLEAGYDVNMVIRNPGEAWQMPLGSASGDGRIEVVGLLLGYGADVNAKDEFGSTALMRASMNGHTNVVQLLLKSGAAVNIQATFIRKTALMFASQYGHTNVVQLLLEYGADVSKSDEYDRTALALATAYGHVDVQNLLRQPGASA
jgi:serine/threonine-protein phosphatase 6 regulatory ankyrin repeat subunit B